MSTHANRVKMTVTSVASSGTGDITLNAASTGFRSFATAYGANATVDILITEGTAWEIARNCTYTHSGTTVSRGTLENSSTGSAVAFTSAAVVSVIAAAEFGNNAEMAIQAVTPGGRLTLESGVPVSTADQTAKTNIYYTPFVHNIINLWDGSQWKPITFTEYTLALGTLTSGKPYDVFAYLNGSALALEVLVWTDDDTRATAVTLQDGRYCKSGDKTRLLLGTFYTTSTTTTENSLINRYVWNAYNQQIQPCKSLSGASHTYDTGTLRNWNNGSGDIPRVNIVNGLPTSLSASVQAFIYRTNATSNAINSTIRAHADGADITGTDIQVYQGVAATGNITLGGWLSGFASTALVAGRHYVDIYEAEYSASSVYYEKGLTVLPGWLA